MGLQYARHSRRADESTGEEATEATEAYREEEGGGRHEKDEDRFRTAPNLRAITRKV